MQGWQVVQDMKDLWTDLVSYFAETIPAPGNLSVIGEEALGREKKKGRTCLHEPKLCRFLYPPGGYDTTI